MPEVYVHKPDVEPNENGIVEVDARDINVSGGFLLSDLKITAWPIQLKLARHHEDGRVHAVQCEFFRMTYDIPGVLYKIKDSENMLFIKDEP